MPPMHPGDVDANDTIQLMAAAANGDRTAADRLLPMVYDQLRRAAQLQMAAERDDHTLSATALVHEAYLKLAGPRDVPWANRAHFFAAAAQAMRRILLDHARSRSAGPRRNTQLSEISDVAALAASDPEQIVAVDAAFARLEAEDPEAAAVVRLRFYAGLSVDQAAEALGLSPRTAARLWNYARVVLYRALTEPH
jgi:RNA polymerase sigma factor (TIGR02999 family)